MTMFQEKMRMIRQQDFEL